jgi:hypothetical protein
VCGLNSEKARVSRDRGSEIGRRRGASRSKRPKVKKIKNNCSGDVFWGGVKFCCHRGWGSKRVQCREEEAHAAMADGSTAHSSAWEWDHALPPGSSARAHADRLRLRINMVLDSVARRESRLLW